MHSIVLAAGMGTRLGGRQPKPLTEVAPELTLIGNQVEILSRRLGRDRLVVVVGHQAMDIITAYPDLMYVYNAQYAETNTAKSLLCALRKIDDDVLWINGDLYFEPDVVDLMLDAQTTCSRILVNEARTGDEEVKYTLHADGSIAQLSKEVGDPCGESLGMQLLMRQDHGVLVEALERVGDQDYFEMALERCMLARSMTLMPVSVGNAFCQEVDFPEDLAVVQAHVAGRGSH